MPSGPNGNSRTLSQTYKSGGDWKSPGGASVTQGVCCLQGLLHPHFSLLPPPYYLLPSLKLRH